MIRTYLAVMVGVLYAGLAQGQSLRSFTPEPQAYRDQLEGFLKEMDGVRSDTVTALVADFDTVWVDFAEEDRRIMYDLSNLMLRKRLVQFDTWNDLLKLVIYFHYNEEPEDMSAWLADVLKYLSSNPSRVAATYLANLRLALLDEVLYQGMARWEARNGEWTFTFDEQPMLVYNGVDIVAHLRGDSTAIEMTSGVYYPQKGTFVGHGGIVYWTRAGLSADTMYAELSNYTLNLKQVGFEADSVTLHSKLYVNQPIVGQYAERLTSQTAENRATFPRFVAYERLEIKDFLPGVDYKGAFSVVGGSFYASDVAPNLAVLKFRYEDRYQVTLRSDRFRLRQGQINSDAAEVSIYLGESDSLYHPKSYVKYIEKETTLTVNRTDEGMSKTPFTNSFHNLDIYLDQVTWNTTSPRIMIQNLNLGTETPLIFESENYYRGERLEAIQGMSRTHPLYSIKRVTDRYDTNRVTLPQMAAGLNMDELNASRFMMQMAIMGFVNYDQNTGWVVVRDKLYEYLLNSEGKRDFDVIRFVSNVSSGANAAISLLNYDMEIAGISGIALSDSQKVAMFPAGQKIVVHEGLNFDFSGRIEAGLFSFWGRNYAFDYEQFKIGMPTIDSMRFKVEKFNQRSLGDNKKDLVSVKNTLQDINGELLIDKPNNKSGKIPYSQYPIFNSGKGSYVYYDSPGIYGGAYSRDKFYVELDAFEIDSLDNITTEGLKFDGVFVSGGIFPDMRQEIMVQEDYSLGFKMTTPPEGLPAYGGKGTAVCELVALSNRGLVGNGHIDYLSSTARSEAFTFFPDSTIGVASTYTIEEQKSGARRNPAVAAEEAKISWQPYQDRMLVRNGATPFRMYGALGMTADGSLEYGSAGLRGSARLNFLDAQTDSRNYTFLDRSFNAQNMDFRVRKDAESDWGFALKDARGEVDFDQGMGDFTLNQGQAGMNFPINKYVTRMDHADWNIEQKTIEVSNNNGRLSEMLSTHRPQDSLRYDAKSAKFSLTPTVLEIYEVPHIDVADSRIMPDTGYVIINPNARMRELVNARLTANRFTKFHNFYEGTFTVRSRKDFSGSAEYEYFDKDGMSWLIFFEKIEVNRSGVTVGFAQVTREHDFYLSPFYAYYGRVNLTAEERLLDFDGHLLIQHTCEALKTNWFKFHSVIDPKDIVIDLPVDDPTTMGDDVFNGIYLSPDSTSVYSGFLSTDRSRVDVEVISATGILFYDESLNSYIITTRERLRNPDVAVNYVAFNNRDCRVTAKGEAYVGMNTGRVKIKSYGIVEHDMVSEELNLDLVMSVDYLFSEEVLEHVSSDINADSRAPGVEMDREAFRVAMSYMIPGERDRKRFFDDLSNLGEPTRLPKSFETTLFFSDVQFVWNSTLRSFIADGEIGIGYMNEIPVNKKVEGLMEIQRHRRGDEWYYYVEPSRDYYFFQYRRNLMQFYSTNQELNNGILAVEMKERSLDRDKELPNYMYNITTRGRVMMFLRRHDRELK